MSQSEDPREWTLWRTTDMRWISSDNDDIGGPIRVIEAEPVERELAELRERAETAEVRIAQLDGLMLARGRELARVEADLVRCEVARERLEEGIREAQVLFEIALRPSNQWPDWRIKLRSWLAAYCPIQQEDQPDAHTDY